MTYTSYHYVKILWDLEQSLVIIIPILKSIEAYQVQVSMAAPFVHTSAFPFASSTACPETLTSNPGGIHYSQVRPAGYIKCNIKCPCGRFGKPNLTLSNESHMPTCGVLCLGVSCVVRENHHQSPYGYWFLTETSQWMLRLGSERKPSIPCSCLLHSPGLCFFISPVCRI